MNVWLIAALGALLVALGVSQLTVPGLVAEGIEQRLTEGGGEADARVRALPAARLLLGDGDRLTIRGRGLRIDLEPGNRRELAKLDGFGEVDVELVEFAAGPVRVREFALTRAGDDPYRLRAAGNLTPEELAAYAAARFGGLGRLLGGLAREAVPEVEPVTFDLAVELISEDGRLRVVRAERATIAGLPAALLVELLGNAIISRL